MTMFYCNLSDPVKDQTSKALIDGQWLTNANNWSNVEYKTFSFELPFGAGSPNLSVSSDSITTIGYTQNQ